MQERGAEAPAVRDITSSGLLAESTFPSGEGISAEAWRTKERASGSADHDYCEPDRSDRRKQEVPRESKPKVPLERLQLTAPEGALRYRSLAGSVLI